MTTHIVPFFGTRTVDRIERRDVEAFARVLGQKGMAANSRANTLNLLSSMFELAINRGWAVRNLVRGVSRPRGGATDPDIRYLTIEQVMAVLRSVPDEELGRVERPLYLAAAMTGMRRGELLGLRWSDVDWEAKRIRVRRNYVRGEFGPPKSRRSSRSFPVTDRLASELQRYSDTTIYTVTGIWCSRTRRAASLGLPSTAPRCSSASSVLSLAPGCVTSRFHDLRHTFGTRMAAAGVPMRTLQEWMGHRDFATTLVYPDDAPSEHEAEGIEQAFAVRAGDLQHGDASSGDSTLAAHT